ncbi:MAG TPA: FtsX-like permease family protein, partial [Acidimicrobiales bacterium]|nr:FtsX-like permease family protein [Acidimicrobiales bacterium]
MNTASPSTSSFKIKVPHGAFRLLSVSLKNLFAHKLRLVAMALSIVLGVGLLTGTYVLGDSFHATFDQIFGSATRNVSVAIRAQAVGSSNSATAPRSAVPAYLLSQVEGLPGVLRATGSVIGYAQFVDSKGKLVGSFGSPNVGMSVGPSTSLGSMVVVRGHFPRGDSQVVMDEQTFLHAKFRIGQEVKVAFRGIAHKFDLVGVVTLGGSSYLAGATIAGFDLPTAQNVMGISGSFSEIDLTARPGTTETALRSEVQTAVGSDYQAVTGTDLSQSTSHDLQQGLSFIPWTLAVFAFIALFLGSLIVFNTFSLVAAQRSWEMALYRCLGATRRQIMSTIVAEASVVGLASCLVGVLWGVIAAGTILPR